MFVEDYRELKIENAENIAGRCFLFEKFVADLLAQEPEALRFKESDGERSSSTRIVMPNRFSIRRSWPRWPNVCLEEKPRYWTQRAAEWQAHSARSQKNTIYRSKSRNACSIKSTISPTGTEVIASGTSCRHQITDLTNLRPKHMAELLAEALL